MTAPSVVTWGRSWFADLARKQRSMRVTAHPGEGYLTLSLWDHQRCIGTLRLADSEVPALVSALTTSLVAGPEPRLPEPEPWAPEAAVQVAAVARPLASVTPLPVATPASGGPATSATDAVSLWLHGPPTVP